MQKIILASSNHGKIREFSRMLAALPLEIIPQSSLDIEDAEETGTTFIENAIIKARHAASLSGLPAIADDSGLMVDALGGDPGVFSARYAADTSARIAKLLQATDSVADDKRGAGFYCVTVLMRSAIDPAPLVFTGCWRGQLLRQPVGEHGFGYDPIFYVPEYQCSVAQLHPDIKDRISHRGQVLQQLAYALANKKDVL